MAPEHLLSTAQQLQRGTTSGRNPEESRMSRQLLSLELSDARRMIKAAEDKAMELKIPYNVAVVDVGGALIAHVRMDGAWIGSIDLAINKAWTARAFDSATDDLAKITQSGQSGFGLNTTNHARVVIFGGGMPIKVKGAIIGAIGASGGSVEQDILVASAGAASFSEDR
jgi:uncharacterized protein GlcG (DUF336 family)